MENYNDNQGKRESQIEGSYKTIGVAIIAVIVVFYCLVLPERFWVRGDIRGAAYMRKTNN